MTSLEDLPKATQPPAGSFSGRSTPPIVAGRSSPILSTTTSNSTTTLSGRSAASNGYSPVSSNVSSPVSSGRSTPIVSGNYSPHILHGSTPVNFAPLETVCSGNRSIIFEEDPLNSATLMQNPTSEASKEKYADGLDQTADEYLSSDMVCIYVSIFTNL